MATQRPDHLAAARQLRPGNVGASRRNLDASSIIARAGGGRGDDGGGGGGLMGNLSNLRDLVVGLPAGVAGLAKGVAEVPVGFGRLGLDVIRGEDFSDDYGTNLGEYFPVLEQFRQSGSATVDRVTNPTQYADSWREGTLLTDVIEDVGNIALPLGAAGRAATAAGATRTGARLSAAARLGDQFGAAPAKVYTAGPAALNRSIQRLTGRSLTDMARPAVEAAMRPGPEAGAVRRRVAAAIDPEVRRGRRDLADSGTKIAEAQAVPLEEMALKLRDANPDLLAAANLTRTGFYERIGSKLRDLPETQFDQVVESTFGGGVTPAAARLAIDAAEGRLSPADAAIFDQARAAADAVADAADDQTFARPGETPEEFIERTGRIEGPADPAQRGDSIMTGKIDTDRRVLRDRGVIRRLENRVLPEVEARALRLRAQADAKRALNRPIAEPPTQRQVLRRGQQQGRTMERLRQSRTNVGRLERELGAAINRIAEADIADTALLNDLAAQADAATAAYNAALDAHNSAVRQVEAATAQRPGSPQVAASSRKISSLVNRLQAAEDLGRPTDALRRELSEARREYTLTRQAVEAGGEADAPSRIQSDRRLGAARAELAAARREANAAGRRLDTAALRSGQTPRTLANLVDRAAQRIDEAQATVDSLERELDAQLGFNAAERTPTLRGTFSRGEATGRTEQRARLAEQEVRKIERRLDNLNQRVARRIDELTSPTGAAVPKRFRQVAAESQRANEALLGIADEVADPTLAAKLTQVADEIPKTLDEFKAAGVNPAYMIGGDVPQRGVKSLRQQDTQLPRIGRETSSRQAKRMHVDYDMANQARLEALKARRLMANQTAMEFLRKYGQDPVAVLGDEARGMTGRELAEAMRERGFIAYNPRSIFNIVNDAEVKIHDDFIVKDSLVRGDTQFLAKNLYDTMAYTLSTKPMHWATQGLLSANQRWKNALLPLSPTWYTGNIFGNAMMAMIGSGIDPVTYTQLMVEGIRQLRRDGVRIRDAVRGGEMPSTAPRRLRTAGLTYAESGALSPDFALRKQGRTRLGRGYRRFSEAAYGANEFFDNLNKNAVYLHELARAEGNPQLMARLETDGLGPDEYAIREALRVMGDFSRMAPWERKAVAVMPFYRWARHITQLTVRLPIEHPMRVAWTLKIPDLFGEDQSDWPAWLQGSVSMGNWVLPVRYLNPFGDVAGAEGPLGVGGALLDPDSFVRSLSPFIKYPVGAFTGLDLGSGIGDDLSMPTDRRRIDPNTGRPTTTPLIDLSGGGINVGGLANLAVNQLPVARNIRDLVFGDVPRYDTGERIESLRPRQPFFQGPARLTQLVGIPEPIHVDDLDEQRARLRSAARRRG